jgi:hypothetical protein
MTSPRLSLRTVRRAVPAVIDGFDCTLEGIGLAGDTLQHGIGIYMVWDLRISLSVLVEQREHPPAASNNRRHPGVRCDQPVLDFLS